MSLNKNNYLRFSGSFGVRPYSFSGSVDTEYLYANMDTVIATPLSYISASLGINSYSLEVVEIVDAFNTPITLQGMITWDGVSQLTIPRPENLLLTTYYIKYTVKDWSGNISPVFIVQILVSAIVTAWVQYPPSAYCTLDSFGNNTGYLAWTQLKLINQGSGTDISPLTLKDNVISDGDYIAPVINLITCPVTTGGTYSPLIISNFSANGANSPLDFITITDIYLACTACGAGGTPITMHIICSIAPGQSQRFNVPALSYDTGITILFSVNPGGNMVTATYQVNWKSNVNGVISYFPGAGPTPVDNSGSFGANPLTVSSPNGLTIFCQ